MNDGKIIIEVKDGKVGIVIDKSLNPIETVKLLMGTAQKILNDQYPDVEKDKSKIEKPSLKDTVMLNRN